ncbi:MAG: MFS transporter [Acidimicrobiia bacterium]|nr:MFS transporter [Acidimicrobiia bacterium]MDH3396754.1 MFS transporter [Acidimicrobiia bacterium]
MSLPATRGTPNEGLTAATLGFFFGFAAVALFGPTAKEFKDLMGLTPAQVGLLVAAPSLSGSLLRIPFSAWVDTTGGRKPFLVLLGTSVVGMAGLVAIMYTAYPDSLTPGMYPILLLLGVLSGSGIATFSVGISQVSYWFPQSRQGWALGTYAGAGNLAPGLFSFLLPLVLAGAGLPIAYVAWLGLLMIGLFLYWRMGQNAPYFQLRDQGLSADQARAAAADLGEELFPAGTALQTLAISARNRKTWALVVLYFTTFGGFIALTAWLPTYWRELHGVSAFAAGALTAVFSLLASAIRIVGGSIADRIGGERTAIASLTLLLVGAAIMTFSDGLVVSVLAEIVMAVGMGVNNAAVFKLVPQEVPEAVGGAAGWVGGLGAFGGFAVPPLMGAFVSGQQLSGYATGFVVFVILALLSLVVAYRLRRHASRPDTIRTEPAS